MALCINKSSCWTKMALSLHRNCPTVNTSQWTIVEDTSFSIIRIGLFTTVAFKEMVLNHKTSPVLIPLKETPKSVPIMVGMKLTVTSRVIWDPVAGGYLWSEFCPLSPKIFSDSLTPSLVLSNGTHIGFAFCLTLILSLPTFWSWQKGFLFTEASLPALSLHF